jgi:hypothetical protein
MIRDRKHLHHPSGLPVVARCPSGVGGAFTGALLHGRDCFRQSNFDPPENEIHKNNEIE